MLPSETVMVLGGIDVKTMMVHDGCSIRLLGGPAGPYEHCIPRENQKLYALFSRRTGSSGILVGEDSSPRTSFLNLRLAASLIALNESHFLF